MKAMDELRSKLPMMPAYPTVPRELLERVVAENERSVCVWTVDDDPDWGSNTWDTCCGERFELTDGTPTMNGFRFCAYCGGRLEEAPPEKE